MLSHIPDKHNKSPLSCLQLLLADSDPCLGQVLTHNLRSMGFQRIDYARSGAEAERILAQKPVDILLTERQLGDGDGIQLVRSIRSGQHGNRRDVPIIMVTARSEVPDVIAARDAGINEFVVKPFAAKTLFSRIERVIDSPKGFVVAPRYHGPDRRGLISGDTAQHPERRHTAPQLRTQLGSHIPQAGGDTPIILPANRSLRQKLGTHMPLSAIVTAEMLAEAEASLHAMAEGSLCWLATDLDIIRACLRTMRNDAAEYHCLKARDAALSLKARAGVFGMHLTSDIAHMLHKFLQHTYRPTRARHFDIIAAYIDALTVVMAQRITSSSAQGTELLIELERLQLREASLL